MQEDWKIRWKNQLQYFSIIMEIENQFDFTWNSSAFIFYSKKSIIEIIQIGKLIIIIEKSPKYINESIIMTHLTNSQTKCSRLIREGFFFLFFFYRKTKILLRMWKRHYIMDKSLLKEARILFNPHGEINSA